MKTFFCTFFCILFFILCSKSFGTNTKLLDVNLDDKAPSQETAAISQLTHILHHAIDGGQVHSHSIKDFLKAFRNKEQWMELLNFYKTAGRAVRAFRMESNKSPRLNNHVKNLSLLFPLSHLIEISAAPAFIALGTVHEFPSIVIASGGSVLSIIAIPGLDPLCLLLLAAYPLKPVYRSVDFIRNRIEKGVRGIVFFTGLDVLFSKTYKTEDRFAFIQQELNKKNQRYGGLEIELTPLSHGSRLSVLSRTHNNAIMSLDRIWNPQKNRFYIKSVWLSQEAAPLLRRSFLRLFSWNTRSAIREAIKLVQNRKNIPAYEGEFFVDQIVADENGIKIVYKDYAVGLKDKTRLNFFANPARRCKEVFQNSLR